MDNFEHKPEALRTIVQAMRDVDNYNLEHENAKMIDKKLFIPEIMKKFDVSEWLAEKWFKEAFEYNKPSHEAILKEEAKVRGIS